MRRTRFILLLLLAPSAVAEQTVPPPATELAPAASFDDIADADARAAALFLEMAKVLQHPRCLNCHPVDGGPLQGDDMQPHQPPVVRADGMGAVAMQCSACHGSDNVSYGGADGSIPGHQPWHLAPLSMGWVGRSAAQICAQLKDTDRNGNRTLEEIYDHNAHDGLVGWGWNPGDGRTPVPGTQDQFGALTRAWIDAGAACPS